MAWTYDGVGNRLSETDNGVVSSYSYPATSNLLASVVNAQATRAFSYDAAGNTVVDTGANAVGMSFAYDVEGRLATAAQTGNPAVGGIYAYDALGRLASRLANAGNGQSTTLYIHDQQNHIIVETDATGATQREYVWMDDLPIAVIDGVASGSPRIYFVHTDHLGRPAKMTDANQNLAWDVIYAPFGAVSAVATTPETLDLRFPGQWFQLETGLAYNWHRHYDATLGRYVQPDPIGLAGGGSLYGYAGGNPFSYADRDGRNSIAIACAGNPACAIAAGAGASAVAMWAITQSLTLKDKVCKCHNHDHPTIYRSGNAGGPNFEAVGRRPQDVGPGYPLIITPEFGASSFSYPTQKGTWWEFPEGAPVPLGICLVNDVGIHWLWAPVTEMPLDAYIDLLNTTRGSWNRVP